MEQSTERRTLTCTEECDAALELSHLKGHRHFFISPRKRVVRFSCRGRRDSRRFSLEHPSQSRRTYCTWREASFYPTLMHADADSRRPTLGPLMPRWICVAPKDNKDELLCKRRRRRTWKGERGFVVKMPSRSGPIYRGNSVALVSNPSFWKPFTAD